MKRSAANVLFLLFLLLAGCDKAFTQTVAIRITGGGELPLRFYSGPGCAGEFIAITTSKQGEVSFKRTAIRGGVAVLLEEPSLCYEVNGKWLVAWQEFVDPADHSSFLCNRRSPLQLACEQLPQGGT